MATLNETNIFGIPPKQPEKKDDSLSRLGISESGYLNRLAKIQNMQEVATEVKAKSEPSYGLGYPVSQRSMERGDLIEQYFADAREAAKDPTEEKRDTALESFFETPFPLQMGQYVFDPTGVPTDITEADYAGRKFRESREERGKGTEFYPGPLGMGDRPFYPDMTPEEAQLKLQQGIAIGSIPPGVGGIAGMFQSILGVPARALRTAKTMDGQGGGGGGISDIQPQPTRDYAGFISSVEKTALGPQKFGSGQDLITYLESPKRSGISTKELEYIDFDQIRNNPDLTKEDVIAHINANRPKVYRIERSEDNPTYRADENDNPLNELPYDQEASDMVNREEAAYFADEYGGELEKQNSSIINNPELQSSGFIVNSENIKNPTVLADLESFINRNPEAYSYTDRPLIKINYPDETESIEVTATDLQGSDAYSFYQLKDVVDDGATLEFPTLKEDPFDIAQEAADLRMSPDYGGEYSVYEAVGDNTGSTYRMVGNDDMGYSVTIDGRPDDHFDDVADARAYIQSKAYEDGDIMEGANTFDTGVNSDQFLETAPYDVFTGEATLPTRYGDDDYSRYRLPMGGAENYREFTLHIENPKTTTRYDSSKGDKHFGGGDELLHYRTSDRIDEDGKRVLFVEEVQSDLHSTASSTKSGANYEFSDRNRTQINKKLSEIDPSIRVDLGNNIEMHFLGGEFDVGGSRFTPNEIQSISDYGKGIINPSRDPNFELDIIRGENKYSIADLHKTIAGEIGEDGLQRLADAIDPILKSGDLPDFPYKGNDFIDLAVKDIMKLAAEGNYERVAFTNPATQLRRNSKDLEYIDSIEVNQVPFLTKAEQQFNEDFMRSRDRAMVSTMSPDSIRYESRDGIPNMRLDGPLVDADLNSFVSVNTDFVVNNPQAQKFWQDFHKNQKIKSRENYETKVSDFVEGRDVVDGITIDPANAANEYEASMKNVMKFGTSDHRTNVDYIFSKADSPLTPTQVAEELQAMGIRRAKARRLQETQEAIAQMQEATPMTNDEAYDGFLNMTEAFYKATERSDSAYHKSLAVPPKFFPKKPFDQLTLDDMPVSPRELANINQQTRQGISYLMGEFRRNTLPNLDNAGKYLVNTKGTGYKVDADKFMIEKGEIQDNYKGAGYDDLDSMIRDLRLDKKTEAIVRKDAEKGNIPVSTKDKQIYQIEAEGGTGKKPKLIYSSLIPKSATKFAKKYNKDAEAKLKKVLYTDEYEDAGGDIIYQAYKKNLGGDDQEMIESAIRTHEAATIDITEEMRKAILEEGVNVMYKGGIVNKVKSMDKPIQGNRREM